MYLFLANAQKKKPPPAEGAPLEAPPEARKLRHLASHVHGIGIKSEQLERVISGSECLYIYFSDDNLIKIMLLLVDFLLLSLREVLRQLRVQTVQ